MQTHQAPRAHATQPETGNATASLRFCDAHVPSLEAGTYEIAAALTLTIEGSESETYDDTLRSRFTVAGPRFAIDASLIGAPFPAPGALGDFSNAFAHLPLARSTLPWERSPYAAGLNPDHAPWLALLVFHPGEAPTVATVTAGDLREAATASPWHPAHPLEDGQAASDPVAVIDVPVALLRAILPSCADLPYTAHVRQALDAAGQPLREQAVINTQRMPARGGISMAFLVSIEQRYGADGFEFQGAADTELIRLVTLKHWRFSCTKPDQTFDQLMLQLDRGRLAAPIPEAARGEPLATSRLAQGYVALPYQVRNGAQTASWYRGPLVGGPVAGALPAALPVLSADALIGFDPATAFFDVSYAAAWTLGRLLMLASPAVAEALHAYKLARLRAAQPAPRRAHLRSALHGAPAAPHALPAEVADWFASLGRLTGVPFDYLVADDAMLPVESIRFFTLDANWLAALFDGALAAGRVSAADLRADATIPAPVAAAQPVTGLLLRSAAVIGWPNLVVTGYRGVPSNPAERAALAVPLLRQDLLAGNTLLCLFAGTVEAVDLHPVPEALHAGLDAREGPQPKTLRSLDTGELAPGLSLAAVPFNALDATRSSVSFAGLAAAISQTLQAPSLTRAQFAMEMIESAPPVRIILTDDGASQ